MKFRQLAVIAFATFAGFGMLVPDVEAARLGGGRSLGMSRNTGTLKQATPSKPVAPTQNAAPAAAPTAAGAAIPPKPASGMSRFLGPIAGLAAGLGIAAMLSHFGMGEGMASFVMIALLVMAAIFVIRLIFAKRAPQPGMQYAGPGGSNVTQFDGAPARFEAANTASGTSGGTAADVASANIPADFDVDGFLRQAKLSFVRLQAANDRGDMEDVKEFTTPEIFAESQMQYQERGKSAQQTDVVQLNAELLDVSTEATRHVASVRFHGLLRETPNATPDSFDEIWHLTKPVEGGRGWLVAGIQQA